MPLALFGITDGTLNLAVNLVILVLIVLWLALAYWVFADARRRIGDPVLVTTASVLGLAPFVGPLIYSIMRPPEFLEDVREREVETMASELRMRHLAAQSCSRCEHPIERSWLRCPECQHRLKDPCVSCNRPVDPRWSICPYCETQLRRPAADSDERESSRRSGRSSRRDESARSERSPSRSSAPPSRSSASPKRAQTAGPSGSAGSADPSQRSTRSDDASSSASDGDPGSTGSRPRRRSTTTP